MKESQANHSLEDLFSDVTSPEPHMSGDLEQREEGRPGRQQGRSWVNARGGRTSLSALGQERLALPFGEAPSAETQPSPSVGSGGQPRRRELDEDGLASPGSTAWRHQLLRTSLYAGLIVGLLVLGARCYGAYAAGRAQLLPFYVGTYLLLLLAAFWRRIPHTARAVSFLVAIYSIGVLDLIQFGPAGDGPIFLLTVPILAAIFLGRLESIVALSLSFLSQAFFWWAALTDQFVPLDSRIASLYPGNWWGILTGAGSPLVFLLLGSGLLVVQNHIVPHLMGALERGRKLTAELGDKQARAETLGRQLKQRALHLQLVVELARTAASRLDIDGILHRAVELIPDYLNCYLASVFLADESGETVTLRAATGTIGAELESEGLRLEVADTSIVGWTAQHRRPYVAREVDGDDLYLPHPVLGGTMSEVAVPLQAGGFLLGVLDVQSGSRGALGDADLRVLRAVADQLALAVQDARQAFDEPWLLEATSPLYRASRRLSSAATVNEVVQVIIDSVGDTEADGCLIGVFEQPSAKERRRASRSDCIRYFGSWDPIDVDPPRAAPGENRPHMLRPGGLVLLADSPLSMDQMGKFWSARKALNDNQLPDHIQGVFEATDAAAFVNVPLRTREGNVGHILVLRRKLPPGDVDPFSSSSMQFFQSLREQAGVALMRASQLDDARRLARREELAGRAAARMHESLDLASVLRNAVQDIGAAMGLAALDVRLGAISGSFDRSEAAGGNGGEPPTEVHGGGEG